MTPAKKSILVVEDDPTIQLCLQILLEDEGYIVRQALTGHEALASFGHQNPEDVPHVVLLDLMLPDMSGEELLAGVFSSEKLAGLPIVIMSAAANAPQVAKKYQKRLLRKPVELDALLEVVAKSCL